MKYKKDSIDYMLSTINIFDVVSPRVELKRSGAGFKGNCPFHDEKTPSFMISPAKNLFKCFGCGVGGGALNFLMMYEKFDFLEAIEYLANQFNFILEKEKVDVIYQKKKDKLELLYEINEKAKDYFINELKTNYEHLDFYLKKRDLNNDILKEFSIGYAKESFNGLYNYLKKFSYSDNILLELGLVSRTKNSKIIDRFINRLIIPILDENSRVIGFGGRTLNNSKDFAKYINSKETPLYNKSKVLYGVNFAKRNIIDKKEVIVVEGYMDLIAMHQFGIKNSVAVSGTAFTDLQIKILKKYAENIILCFDGDEAGEKAAKKMIAPMFQNNINCEVLTLPLGEDPDSYLRNFGKDAFIDFLNNTKKDILSYYMELLKNKNSDNFIIVEEILGNIFEIDNKINLHFILKKVSDEFKIPLSILNEKINELKLKKRLNKDASINVDKNLRKNKIDTQIQKIENELMLIFLEYPNYLSWNLINMFKNDEIRIVLGFLLESYYSKKYKDKLSFLEKLKNEISLEKINYLKITKPKLINTSDNELIKTITNDFFRKLEFYDKKKYIDSVSNEIKDLLESDCDINDFKSILNKKQDLFLRLKQDLYLIDNKNYL